MSNQEIDLNLYQLDAKTEMKNQQSNGMFKTIVDAFAYRHISPFATAVYPRYYQLGFSLFSIVAVLQSLGQETDVPIDNYTLIKQNES